MKEYFELLKEITAIATKNVVDAGIVKNEQNEYLMGYFAAFLQAFNSLVAAINASNPQSVLPILLMLKTCYENELDAFETEFPIEAGQIRKAAREFIIRGQNMLAEGKIRIV